MMSGCFHIGPVVKEYARSVAGRGSPGRCVARSEQRVQQDAADEKRRRHDDPGFERRITTAAVQLTTELDHDTSRV